MSLVTNAATAVHPAGSRRNVGSRTYGGQVAPEGKNSRDIRTTLHLGIRVEEGMFESFGVLSFSVGGLFD